MDHQLKYNVLLKSVIMSMEAIQFFGPDHPHWEWLRKADVVFVYCSRNCENGKIIEENKFGKTGKWEWWELPAFAKRIMRPDAKMVVQFDDDFQWVFHKGWNWFPDELNKDETPEGFFSKNHEVFEIADEYWTVCDNPEWMKFTKKLCRYMPLPQLWRYKDAVGSLQIYLTSKKPFRLKHKDSIALLRHTSMIGSVQHTLDNVCTKLKQKYPICYFASKFSTEINEHGLSVSKYTYLNRDDYMRTLDDCFLAFDDTENYDGWSRFAMECAILGIPVIGSTYVVKLFFPELYTVHNDYAKQIELADKLINESEFYEKIVKEGMDNCFSQLDGEFLCQEMIKDFRNLGLNETKDVDVSKEYFKVILDKLLPWHMPPPRPKDNDRVFDNYTHRSMTQADWDEFYGRFAKFISNDDVLKALAHQVVDEQQARNKL